MYLIVYLLLILYAVYLLTVPVNLVNVSYLIIVPVANLLFVVNLLDVVFKILYRVFRKNCVFSQFTATPPSPTSF